MIKIHGTRKKNGRLIKDCPALYEADLEGAFKTLVDGELKFGGRLKDATLCFLKIETSILGGSSIDTTFFEGTSEEMAPLVAVALAYEKELGDHRDDICEEAFETLRKLETSREGVSALMCAHMGPLLIGEGALNRAVRKIMQDV